jgi:3-oxoacyl-[acyl-carrier protein] reductase
MLQNNPEEGVIINISSTPAIAGHIEGASYTIAKAANIALTKCIVLEYGDKNIRAYTLALDNIATLAKYYSMNENDRNKATEGPSMRRWAGLKRSPRLMHVSQVIIFLLLQVIPL